MYICMYIHMHTFWKCKIFSFSIGAVMLSEIQTVKVIQCVHSLVALIHWLCTLS